MKKVVIKLKIYKSEIKNRFYKKIQWNHQRIFKTFKNLRKVLDIYLLN